MFSVHSWLAQFPIFENFEAENILKYSNMKSNRKFGI